MKKIKKNILKISLPLFTSLLLMSCSAKSNNFPPTPLQENQPKDVNIFIKWHQKTGNGDNGLLNYKLSPFVNNNTIYVPNENGQLFALNLKNGSIIWKKKIEGNISSQPNTIYNTVIFGTRQGQLYSLDSKNGQKLWEVNIPSSLVSQPSIYDNYIFLQTHDGSISKYRATTGFNLWSQTNIIPSLILNYNSSPLIINNNVMIGTSYGTLLGYMLDIDGSRTINIPIAIPKGESQAQRMVDITANPLIYHKFLVVASYQGALVVLNKDTGKIIWAKKSSVINNIAINNNIIYTTQSNSELIAFDIKNGQEIWKESILKYRKITAPTYYKGMIVVADYKGNIFFFNAKNGNYLGMKKITEGFVKNSGIKGQLIATQDGIVVEDNSGNVYLIKANSNKVKYKNILSDYKLNRGYQSNMIIKPEK